jgi:hypothetical protein
MNVDEIRAGLVMALQKAEAALESATRERDCLMASLASHDQAVEAMRSVTAPAPRRDLRGEVAAKLTDKPQSIEAIRAAVGNIKRSQVEAILIRMPLVAQKTAAGWMRAGGDLLSEAAE